MAIPNKPDFSKIFGSNASSILAFTDENYLRGWEYLGQEPPSYQLFNDLQFKNDTRLKWLADSIDYLLDNSLKTNDLATAIDSHNKSQSAHSNILSAIKVGADALKAHRETGIIDHPDGSITTPKFRDKSVTLNKLADEVVEKLNTNLKKSDIQVITGEVANGGTIPLPTGFLESECQWFAGVKRSNVNEWYIDINDNGRNTIIEPKCELNGRIVSVGTQVVGLNAGSYTYYGSADFGLNGARVLMPGTAWYICIGIHR